MNKEIKGRWVAKLREPGRLQGMMQLRDAEGAQCCLDVLNEVAVEDEVIAPAVFNMEENKYEYVYEFEDEVDGELVTVHEFDTLPFSVRDWAGLDNADPYVNDIDRPVPASTLNDVRAYDFLKIADLIEADENL